MIFSIRQILLHMLCSLAIATGAVAQETTDAEVVSEPSFETGLETDLGNIVPKLAVTKLKQMPMLLAELEAIGGEQVIALLTHLLEGNLFYKRDDKIVVIAQQIEGSKTLQITTAVSQEDWRFAAARLHDLSKHQQAAQHFSEEFGVGMHEVRHFVCDVCAHDSVHLERTSDECRTTQPPALAGHALSAALFVGSFNAEGEKRSLAQFREESLADEQLEPPES